MAVEWQDKTRAPVHGPVLSGEFDRMMNNIGFFENSPLIAVGVSGGADSLALLVLVDEWARMRGGRAIGLTVDHGLRSGSGTEALWVANEAQNRGIEHHILTWQDRKPVTGIQEKARNARRQLLLDWCRDNGVLHLCLGHHVNDQVETHLMRMARGSGFVGQAGMSQIREYAHARIIRPLLSVEKDRLEATLLSMEHGIGQSWLDDPSNDREQFERVRVRRAVCELAMTGGGLSALADSIREQGVIRRELEELGAQALASSAALYPAGYARLDVRALNNHGDVVAAYALSRLIKSIGGLRYPVAREKLERTWRLLLQRGAKGRLTVGGCLFSRTGNGVLVTREERNLPPRQPVTVDQHMYWDNRFMVSLGIYDEEEIKTGGGPGFEIGGLRRRGWDRLVRTMPELRRHSVPLSARYALPALFHDGEIIAVSHLTNRLKGIHPHGCGFEKAAFSPPEPVFGGMFSVALADFCTISDTQNATVVTDERNDA